MFLSTTYGEAAKLGPGLYEYLVSVGACHPEAACCIMFIPIRRTGGEKANVARMKCNEIRVIPPPRPPTFTTMRANTSRLSRIALRFIRATVGLWLGGDHGAVSA